LNISDETDLKTMAYEVQIGSFKVGAGNRPFLIAGPCVIESEQLVLDTAGKISEITRSLGIPYVFKASFDKANRTSIKSYRGPGIEQGLAVLKKVKDQLGLPVLTDVHTEEQATEAGKVVDVLQIPAFLCRQTDLLIAAAKTGKVVNVKKGQFLSPPEMANAVKKVEECGSQRIVLTERGSSFGYNNLVVDMRSFPIMRSFGYPVVFDATHSVQLPGGGGTKSSGQREFVEPLACAAAGAGVDGFFMEVHPNPDEALSDGPNMVPLHQLKSLLERVMRICDAAKPRS
jgi:2-dehydro-3-deoxyphosphooctonate aldolase (KDO 8-P synthase)